MTFFTLSVVDLNSHINDIAFVIYTIAVVVWGSVFALVFRRRLKAFRNCPRRGLALTPDEWIIIGLMIVGLLLGVIYARTFLVGKPPGISSLTTDRP